MRLLTISLFLLICPTPSFAQFDIEYGRPEELNGVRRVYVNTGTDLNGRENIMKVLKKDLPDVVLVDRVEDAEIALIYSSNSYAVLNSIITQRNSSTTGTVSLREDFGTYNGSYSGRTTGTSVTTPVYRNVTDGAGLVVKFTSKGRSRLLMDFKDTKKTLLERRPSTNFARKFVGAYKKVNVAARLQPQPIPPQPVETFAKNEVEALDLDGMWNYSGGPVWVERKHQNVRVSYPSANNCNGLSVTELLSGELQGTMMRGKLTICTNEILVKSCAFPHTSVISFMATVDPAIISVTAIIPGISITYGKDGRCNVNNDAKQNSEYRFVLTRSNQ